MTPPAQHGCEYAIRKDDNQNLFECMYMGDCIHKEVVDRRPLLYRCHCASHTAANNNVLDELHFIAEMDRMSFDNAICLSGIEEGSRKEDFIKIMALANIGKKANVTISVRK